MKSKISFLAIFAIVLNVNYVYASECIGSDCELMPVETADNIEVIDVLAPVQYTINWAAPSEPETCQETCEYDYNCPFDTAQACAVWYKKPAYKTAVTPRPPHVNPVLVDDMIYAIQSNSAITANDSEMKPLLQRYKMLMNASDACCTSGIIYKMRKNGASDKAVYEFLKDDANYYAVTKRCLVMNDDEIESSYSYGVNGKMVADVRNACLCKNRQWFDSLLQPFTDLYERVPGFAENDFIYSYIDGMQRETSVSVNADVQNTVGLMNVCPK